MKINLLIVVTGTMVFVVVAVLGRGRFANHRESIRVERFVHHEHLVLLSHGGLKRSFGRRPGAHYIIFPYK